MRVRGRWILLAIAVVAAGYGLWSFARGPSSGVGEEIGDARIERIVPDSLRIKVEVLNATNIRGLARRGTSVMRDLASTW